ncbi:MAG: sulfatase [Lentisphaerales bacterium]|nr:sulfatase [Lentisphaerales bacterium]
MKNLFIFAILMPFFCALAQQKPNVLFIFIDDLNTRLNCYGESHIKSPNIDSLASSGTRFDRAYCQYPSCGPSRASILSGLRPQNTGILDNKTHFRDALPNVVTLPQHFKNNGYFVARVGKVYHQHVPAHIGTSGPDDPMAWSEIYNPIGRDKAEENLLTVYTPQLPLADQMCYLKAEGTDDEQTDGKVVSKTIELLKEKRNQPFMIFAGLYRPHIPYIAPKKYFDLYDLDKVKLPEIAPNYRSLVPEAALASTSDWPNFGTTAQQAKECIQAYDACVSFVDAQVGRLLKSLDDLKLRENTIVILASDHGYHLGEHGLWRKNTLFEESTRTPLIISAPGITGNTFAKPVEFLNIYPTLAELAGLKTPTQVEGKSMVQLMKNPESNWQEPAFSQTKFRKAPGYSVRTEKWRYVEWGKNGESGKELYNCSEDPQELNNLADSKEFKEVQIKLAQLIQRNWYKQ